jgi:hypothetical protein
VCEVVRHGGVRGGGIDLGSSVYMGCCQLFRFVRGLVSVLPPLFVLIAIGLVFCTIFSRSCVGLYFVFNRGSPSRLVCVWVGLRIIGDSTS